MARNTAVFGIYSDRGGMDEGVQSLKKAGFRNTDISVLFQENTGSKDLAHKKSTKAPEGATAGATSGAVLGGVLGWLAGIGALAIPGLGAFIAAGPIMGLLAGVGAGGAAGGVIGALVGMGTPEYEAKRYEGRIRKGGFLISVHCDSAPWENKAKEILKQTGAEDISTALEEKADFASSSKPLARLQPSSAVYHDPPRAQLDSLLVRDVMNRNVESIDAEASRKMRDLGVGFLPVRSNQDVVGIITDRDITARANTAGYDPLRTSVAAAMTGGHAFCFDNQSVTEAANILEDKGERRLLVLDGERRLVGVISIDDLAARASVAPRYAAHV